MLTFALIAALVLKYARSKQFLRQNNTGLYKISPVMSWRAFLFLLPLPFCCLSQGTAFGILLAGLTHKDYRYEN